MAAPTSTPTPTQHENDSFRVAVATQTLPPTYCHKMDGSAIDPASHDPTPISTPSWP